MINKSQLLTIASLQACLLVFLFTNCAGDKKKKSGNANCNKPVPTATPTVPASAPGVFTPTPTSLGANLQLYQEQSGFELLADVITFDTLKPLFKLHLSDCKTINGAPPKVNCEDYNVMKSYPTPPEKFPDVIARNTPVPPADFINKVYNWDINGRPQSANALPGTLTPTPAAGSPINPQFSSTPTPGDCD